MQDAELAGLKAYMADNPGAVIEDVARERKVTPRAVLEVTGVDVVPFDEVTAEHAHAEGEGDRSLAA